MRPLAFIKDVSTDGFRIISLVGPVLAAVFWVGKLFFGTTLMLDDWSWAWGFAPLTVWLAIAYLRRWIAYQSLEKDKENIEEELENERDNNLPNLSGEIHTVITGEVDQNQGASCLLNVTIRNVGAPTAIDGWAITVKATDSNSYVCQLQTLENRKYFFDDKYLELQQDDAIYEKTIKPIPRGGFERGWILGILRMPRDLILPMGTEFIMKFNDMMGKQYTSAATLGEGSKDDLKYYPDGRGLKFNPIEKDESNNPEG